MIFVVFEPNWAFLPKAKRWGKVFFGGARACRVSLRIESPSALSIM